MDHNNLRSACALFMTAMIAAQPQTAQAEANKCGFSLLAKLPVLMEGPRASVAVKLNGTDTRLWLDSGAFFNFMPKAKAAELGLASEALPFGFYITGIGGSVTPELTRVRDFGIAGATLHNMEFIVGGSDSGNGFLGANILGMWDTEFDLAKGAVNLFQEKNCGRANIAYWSSGMSVGEARLLNGENERDRHIYVEVFVNGHPLRAVLDSGAPTTIINRSAAERAGIDLESPSVIASRQMSGIGTRKRQSWIAHTQTIAIGGEEIANSPIRVIDDEAGDRSHDMLLGVDFLMSHHVIVSQPQRKMFLTYNGGAIFSATTDQEIGHRSTTRGENLGAVEKAADPKTADEFAGRASARLHTGELAGAVSDFTDAIKLAPSRADLLAERASAYARSGKPELAAKDIEAALTLSPHDHLLLIRRARIRLSKGDRVGALDDAEAAAASVPKGALDAMSVAALYEHLGLADRALELIDPVVAMHRTDAVYSELLNARAWNRALANRDLDHALDDINLAIKKAGQRPAMLDTRALVQLRRKNYAAAIADETAALEQNAKMPAALFTRGLALAASGDPTGGEADVSSARKMQPTIDRVYAWYGLRAQSNPLTEPAADDDAAD